MRTQVRSATRTAYDRVLRMHRRYTGRYGDALASGVAYATLVGGVPAAVLLAVVAPDRFGDGLAVLLPGTVVDLADDLPIGSLALRTLLVVALAWASLRLVRALRTAVRAVCDQRAGTGDPVRDLAHDVRLAGCLGLLALAGVAVVSAGAALGRPVGLAAAVVAWTAALTVLPRLLTHPLAGRPSWRAAARSAPAGAVALVALVLVADAYVRLTEQVHEDVYRGAGVLVGVAVWVSASARVVLRTVAWAATSEEPS